MNIIICYQYFNRPCEDVYRIDEKDQALERMWLLCENEVPFKVRYEKA